MLTNKLKQYDITLLSDHINIFKLVSLSSKMRKSNVLTLIGSILVGSSLVFGQEFAPQRENLNPKLEERVAFEETLFYKAVDEIVIKDLVKNHINNVNKIQPGSVYFSRLHYGFHIKLGSSELADRELAKWISVPQELCLKLAMEYEDKKIPEEEYEKLSMEILRVNYWLNKYSQANSASRFASKSDINYRDANLHKAIKFWGMLKTWEFQKLVLASKEIEDGEERTSENYVRKIYQRAFEKEEYEDYVEKLNKYELNVENALKGAVTGPMKSATREEIGRIGKSARQTMQKTISKYFE